MSAEPSTPPAAPATRGRFKPGQSGNPRGRPPGRPDARTKVTRALMSVIRTKRNLVVAYEPDEADTHCQITWHASGELHGSGRYSKPFHGPVEPIERYQEAVDWAVGMADAMAYPLHVLPLRADQARDAAIAQVQREVDNLPERRRGMVTQCLMQMMRDSDEAFVRAEAFDILAVLGVGNDQSCEP